MTTNNQGCGKKKKLDINKLKVKKKDKGFKKKHTAIAREIIR